MRILFCNDSYPGSFGKMPSRLASDPANKVMFLSFYPRRNSSTPGIIHARLKLARERIVQGKDAYTAEWDKAFKLARQAYQTFRHIRESGFTPDIIFVTFFNGPALFLRQVFPESFIVSYSGPIRSRSDTDARKDKIQAMTAIQGFQLTQSNLHFVRSESQKRNFLSLLHPIIHIRPPYVDTDFFSPRPGNISLLFPHIPTNADQELVTFHMKGTSASSQDTTRIILGLLTQRPHCLAALCFGGGMAKKGWEHICNLLPDNMCSRLLLIGGLELTAYRNLLCSSAIHIFFEKMDMPLQTMLETMSCETLLMGPINDDEGCILKDRETMIALPEDVSEIQLKKICSILNHKEDFFHVKKRGRQMILDTYSEHITITKHIDFVMEEYKKFRNQSPCCQSISN